MLRQLARIVALAVAISATLSAQCVASCDLLAAKQAANHACCHHHGPCTQETLHSSPALEASRIPISAPALVVAVAPVPQLIVPPAYQSLAPIRSTRPPGPNPNSSQTILRI